MFNIVIQLDKAPFLLAQTHVHDPTTQAYITFYTDVVKSLEGNATTAAKDAEAILEFDLRMNNAAYSNATAGNVSQLFSQEKLKAFQQEFDTLQIANLNATVSSSCILLSKDASTPLFFVAKPCWPTGGSFQDFRRHIFRR